MKVEVTVQGGEARIFLNRPDKSNAWQNFRAWMRPTLGRSSKRIHRVCQAIRALPVPVVARLHGAVIGAGLEIAAACDLRIAAKGTRFAMPEVKLGIPSVVTPHLDQGVENLLKKLLAADPDALRAQKRLLQLWDEAPLARSVAQSVAAFSQSFAGGNTISSRLAGKKD